MSRERSLVQFRYGSLRILIDGRVRFSPATLPDLPELDFSAHYGIDLGGGRYVEDRANYNIYARWPGNSSFFILHMARHRVQSACFSFLLSPDELRRGVALLRKAGGGVERWIAPGLEWTQRHLAEGGGNYPQTLKIIPELLESVRDIPRPRAWEATTRAASKKPGRRRIRSKRRKAL